MKRCAEIFSKALIIELEGDFLIHCKTKNLFQILKIQSRNVPVNHFNKPYSTVKFATRERTFSVNDITSKFLNDQLRKDAIVFGASVKPEMKLPHDVLHFYVTKTLNKTCDCLATSCLNKTSLKSIYNYILFKNKIKNFFEFLKISDYRLYFFY